jgi:hypothetical protein
MKPTNTTVTAPNDVVVTVEQQDNEDPTVGREKEKGIGVKQDRTSKRDGERRGANAEEPERTTTTQSEPVWFDWAAEVNNEIRITPSQPVCVLAKPTVTLFNGDVAPHAPIHATNTPTVLTTSPMTGCIVTERTNQLQCTPIIPINITNVHARASVVPQAAAPAAPILVDPDPGQATNPTGIALAKTDPTNLHIFTSGLVPNRHISHWATFTAWNILIV